MELMIVDPRALKENPDQMRRSKSSPQADALLLASIKAVGIVQPAMLDQMAKGDMPGEPQLRIIAAASIDEQSEVWKKYKPRKADPQVSWHDVARALTKTRMYARHASFDNALATAYGIAWVED